MLIRDLSKEECLMALSKTRIGRLGCARDNQPYVVPIYFAYHMSAGGAPYLYSFTTEGQKVDWMRSNPLVCVECDEIINYNHWTSVIVSGRFQELPSGSNAPEPHHISNVQHATARTERDDNAEWQHAYELLREFTTWWQTAYAAFIARSRHAPTHPYAPLYYRIHIDGITGRRAEPKPVEDLQSVFVPPPTSGWLRRIIRAIIGN